MYQISIIIPIYKTEKYIERCAISLFEQTLKSIEYIFVNDCTPDNSIQILKNVLKRYPNRISDTKIINHEFNRGLAAARNTGRSIAQGEYIIDCDSDDWVSPNAYEMMYQQAIDTNSDIVVCDWNEIYATHVKHVHVTPFTNNIDCVIAILSGQMHGGVWNKLIKKSLYKEYHITCTEGINFLEDLSVTYKLFYFAKSITYINKPLYNYSKENTNSYTSTCLSEQSQKGMIKLTEQIQFFFEKENYKTLSLNQAILFFKLAVKSTILLQGKPIVSTDDLCINTSLKEILSHPTLSIYFKSALILDYIHCRQGIKFLRYLKRI